LYVGSDDLYVVSNDMYTVGYGWYVGCDDFYPVGNRSPRHFVPNDSYWVFYRSLLYSIPDFARMRCCKTQAFKFDISTLLVASTGQNPAQNLVLCH